jgi:hypothetical protein
MPGIRTRKQLVCTRSSSRHGRTPLPLCPPRPARTTPRSLPWVSQDGYFEIFQYDDWTYENTLPEDREGASMGAIRSMYGLPYKPPPPPDPTSPAFAPP